MKRRLGLSEILDTYSILMKYDEVQCIYMYKKLYLRRIIKLRVLCCMLNLPTSSRNFNISTNVMWNSRYSAPY